MRLLLPAAPVAVLVAVLATGCSAQACDDLAALRAERDAARAEYAELVAGGTASAQETTAADEVVHDLDARVFDAEQQCEDR